MLGDNMRPRRARWSSRWMGGGWPGGKEGRGDSDSWRGFGILGKKGKNWGGR